MTSRDPVVSPPAVLPGDTIGIIAPSSPFDAEIFRQGLAALESMGYRAAVSEDVFVRDRYLAGSDGHRARHLMRLLEDPAVKALMGARGGYGAMRMLGRLDFEKIRKHPKLIIGYSDMSALFWALYSRCRWVTLHGPTLLDLATASKASREALVAALSPHEPVHIQLNGGFVISPGTGSGPVTGGNLTTLCHLVGTAFAPSFRGQILVLEDCGEQGYRIDRMLTQMKMSGCFEDLAGLILGTFEKCGPVGEVYRIFADTFADASFPILAGFEIGHGHNNIAVPLGVRALLDAGRQCLCFHAPAASG